MRISPIPLLALLLACALVLAGCGDGDGDRERGDAKAEHSTSEASGGGEDGPPASDPDDRGGEAATFTIEVRDGQVVGGPQALPVASGDDVEIEVLSDTADEVHLHGIDQALKLTPGEPGVLRFTAEDAGSYELEMHDSGVVLGNVHVS